MQTHLLPSITSAASVGRLKTYFLGLSCPACFYTFPDYLSECFVFYFLYAYLFPLVVLHVSHCRPTLLITVSLKNILFPIQTLCQTPCPPAVIVLLLHSCRLAQLLENCCKWMLSVGVIFSATVHSKSLCWCTSVGCWVGKLCPWTHICSQQGCKTPSSSKNTEMVFVQSDSAYTTHPSEGVWPLIVLPFCSDFGRGEMQSWSQVCYSQDGPAAWPLSAGEISTLS